MTVPGLLASTLVMAVLLAVFVVVASFAVRSEASAALVLVGALVGLMGLRATNSRHATTRHGRSRYG